MNPLPVGPHRVEAMVKDCLETARQMLEKNGAFSPWGAVIDASGDRKLVAASLEGEPKSAAEQYAIIEQGMARQYFNGEIVAGAILAEASVPAELKPDYPEAVRLVVESNTISRLIFLPFQRPKPVKEGSESAWTFGELIGVNVQKTIFARS